MSDVSKEVSKNAGAGETAPVYDQVSVIARQLILGSYDRLLPKDDTLLTRGGGSAYGLRLYDELERDPKAWEVLEKRVMSLTAREWRVEPPSGDTSRASKKAADMVRSQLESIGFDQMTKSMLAATLKGLSTHEIMWARDGSEIVAEEVIDLEPWMFTFMFKPDPDDYVFARCGVRLLSTSSLSTGEKVPQKKFVLHRFGAKYNNPWGLGLGTRLFWPIFFKRQGIQFWLSFAERFGTPVPIGKYPNNATIGEKNTLRGALRAFQQEASIMVPMGMDIQLLEAARAGIDTYECLCRYMDEQISGIVLGKTNGSGTGGNLASAVLVENEMRLELVKADGDLLSDTLNRQLVKWIVDYNMPGTPYPRVTRVVEEVKDMKDMATTDKLLFDMGYRPTLASVQRRFGGEYIEVTPAPATAPVLGTATAEFSDPDISADQAAADAFIASISSDVLQPLMVQLLKPVMQAIRTSSDHQGALERLVELFPNIELDALQESLARALFVMDTWGRLNGNVEAV